MSTQDSFPPFRRTYLDGCGFEPDPFQIEGLQAVESGDNVLVTAPTGAGKTMVGEYAVFVAHHHGGRSVYTTPLKSLSNQKYEDFATRFGTAEVGLITGDVTINADAPIVVMTTEVLRNMMYENPDRVDAMSAVVLDEVHYLGDASRGHIWEEILFYLPSHVQVTGLSATISNADEFAGWIRSVRNSVRHVSCSQRPIPLDHFVYSSPDLVHFYTHDASSSGTVATSRLSRALASSPARDRGGQRRGRPGTRRGGDAHHRSAQRLELLRSLAEQSMLPGICFIFSRAGCDDAVHQLAPRLQPMLSAEQRRRAVAYARDHLQSLSVEEKSVVGYDTLIKGLQVGIAAHHAGLLPAVKHVIEHLFRRGDIAVVFATETLSLGINMPARSVIIDSFIKFDGVSKRLLNPLEYTQLTGRAGRRGLDDRGRAVCVASEALTVEYISTLTSRSGYPLSSVFTPGYNTTINMMSELGKDRAHRLLAHSFAQYQRDIEMVGVHDELAETQRTVERLSRGVECGCGDVVEYLRLRRRLSDAQKSAPVKVKAVAAPKALATGQVYRERGSGTASLFVVLPQSGKLVALASSSGRLRKAPLSLLRKKFDYVGQVGDPARGGSAPVSQWVDALNKAHPPHSRGHTDKRDGRQAPDRVAEVTQALSAHPTHRCALREDHAQRNFPLMRAMGGEERLRALVHSREGGLAKEFDRRCEVLALKGLLHGDGVALSERAERFRRFHTPVELISFLVMEQLTEWEYSVADLAAIASCFSDEVSDAPERFAVLSPSDTFRDCLESVVATVREVHEMERQHGVPLSGYPLIKACMAVHGWAAGWSLVEVLTSADMSAGDFVKRCQRTIDVLREWRQATSQASVAQDCDAAIAAINRGLVSAEAEDVA